VDREQQDLAVAEHTYLCTWIADRSRSVLSTPAHILLAIRYARMIDARLGATM
jgi:hypothetical protein